MYALFDTFNKNIVSRHRTIGTAVKADQKLQSGFRNGSYLPTTIKRIEGAELVDLTEYEVEEMLARYDR